jgi:hypothetical protein
MHVPHPREPRRGPVTFGHDGVTLHNVTFGQKAPLGRKLGNFQLCMRTPKGTLEGVTWPLVTSSSPGTCTTIARKKTGEKPCMCRTYFRLWRHFRALDFRSGPLQITWLPVTSLPVAPPHSSTANVPWAVPIYWSPVSSIWNSSVGVVVFVVHFIIANIYFDSDMSKSTNTVVYFDWKTVIYIYACGICRTQFMLPNSSRR